MTLLRILKFRAEQKDNNLSSVKNRVSTNFQTHLCQLYANIKSFRSLEEFERILDDNKREAKYKSVTIELFPQIVEQFVSFLKAYKKFKFNKSVDNL